MSNPRTTVGEASRLGLASWCLYDWANSAFPTIVTTFVFSVYFTRAVADDPVDGAVQWSHSVTAAALAVVLGAPALGAIADGLGRRKPWLLAFTALKGKQGVEPVRVEHVGQQEAGDGTIGQRVW
jgi:UMF1 family MFS transporter